ncbi:MAG: hypothetical protein IJ783_08615 [Kiritimatiellae bacterium]|nr:hypothetical protein [Kiritimatiellia bacterium]
MQSRAPSRSGAYWLYGISNLGSFCGLLAYPPAIGPFVPAPAQLALFAAGLAACAAMAAARRTPFRPDVKDNQKKRISAGFTRETLPEDSFQPVKNAEKQPVFHAKILLAFRFRFLYPSPRFHNQFGSDFQKPALGKEVRQEMKTDRCPHGMRTHENPFG